MKQTRMLAATLLVASVIGSTVMAAEPTTKPPSCDHIRQALKSGQSEQQVASSLKVTLARVHECSKPAK